VAMTKIRWVSCVVYENCVYCGGPERRLSALLPVPALSFRQREPSIASGAGALITGWQILRSPQWCDADAAQGAFELDPEVARLKERENTFFLILNAHLRPPFVDAFVPLNLQNHALLPSSGRLGRHPPFFPTRQRWSLSKELSRAPTRWEKLRSSHCKVKPYICEYNLIVILKAKLTKHRS
jgi:hypothetical protein